MSAKYQVVETNAALEQVCHQYRGSGWLAIDTEFEREKTFYPELCLLQVANAELVAVIDPLSIDNLQPLFELLYDSSITKVFHAARQDLEIFFNLKGSVPGPVFDTQLAAPLLGYDEQIGYANLVGKMLGVNLSKTHTRTDWKRRPLQSAQLDYAADDVIYLGKIYTILLEQLTENKRLEWLRDEFAGLCDPLLYEPDADGVWKKNRGAKKLKGKKLCALQHLSAWRERAARSENRPRNWLMRDETLLNLAQLQPQTIQDLERVKGLNDGQRKKYGSEIIDIILASGDHAAAEQESKKSSKPLNIQEEAKIDLLSAIVKIVAGKNNLHPNILAPKKELEKLLRKSPDCLLLHGWREHMIGNALTNFLDGKTSLQLIADEIVYRQN